jgi:hypothetical protein
MKRSLKLFHMAAFILVLPTVILLAQDRPADGVGKPPKPMTAEETVSRMKADLSLTDKQVTQVTPVITNEISQIESLMDQERSGNITRDKAREKMDAVRKDTQTKLAVFLTSEQLVKWKKMCEPPKRDRPE